MTHYIYKVMQDILKSLKLKKIKTFNIAKKTLIINSYIINSYNK